MSLRHSGASFEVETPIGIRVRTTAQYWELITTIKHPTLRNRADDVIATLRHPQEVRVSKRDSAVYLFYRSDGERRWICAAVKRLNGDGFLITAYRTSNIKEGNRIWPK